VLAQAPPTLTGMSTVVCAPLRMTGGAAAALAARAEGGGREGASRASPLWLRCSDVPCVWHLIVLSGSYGCWRPFNGKAFQPCGPPRKPGVGEGGSCVLAYAHNGITSLLARGHPRDDEAWPSQHRTHRCCIYTPQLC
jgi:hypothetical protein